jgi:hypothetical protein
MSVPDNSRRRNARANAFIDVKQKPQTAEEEIKSIRKMSNCLTPRILLKGEIGMSQMSITMSFVLHTFMRTGYICSLIVFSA